MQEVLDEIEQWRTEGGAVALATVVETWGSAPRRPGAKMALTPEGKIAGSVSGGCVEGAVFEAGVEVLEQGRPRLLHFGVADEIAWDVGLACGGEIDIFVEALDDDTRARMASLAHAAQGGVAAVVVAGPPELLGLRLFLDGNGDSSGALPAALEGGVQRAIGKAAARALATGASRRETIDEETGLTLFFDVLLPPPTLIMVGGVQIAQALAAIARSVHYQTIVIDPRRAFGSQARFPAVDRLIQKWPQEAFDELTLTSRTAVALLTHDPKIDDPALKIVLDSPAFYAGALGSSRTHAQRRERLLNAGLAAEQVARIHGPIGLDINAQTPEEIAVAIMAEIVSVRRQREAEERKR
ncbi:MAG: XdhC family protein [Candidatus Promineifilaceae bacterium]|nr:XdhC family protein [Candidatus Promineifilaceae bacterium]